MSNDIKIKFWRRILEIRKEKWISQEQLWYLAKIHRTYISDIERGVANITLEQIIKLSKALNIGLYDLFNFECNQKRI